MAFVSRQPVRFAHVDAAGIVFYPRYFEMLNAAVEDYFAAVVGTDFRAMHLDRGLGIPTVKIECEFLRPSRLGDMLDYALRVDGVGRSSAHLTVTVSSHGEHRLTIRLTIVCMDLPTGRSLAWPDDVRPIVEAQAA